MAVLVGDDVQARAQAALKNSPFYELRELKVRQRDDALMICGNVSSFYHKQIAQEVVRSVCGDIELVNLIEVKLDEENS